MKTTSILFDLDGTLIDSAPSILAGYAAVLQQRGIRPKRPLESSLIGPPLIQTMRAVTGIDNEAVLAELAAEFKAHYDSTGYRDTLVYPGVSDTLRRLVKTGVKLFIVTNKRILPTRRIIEHCGWSDLFVGVYAHDAFEPALTSKAEVIAAVLDKHGLNANSAAYVGDRSEDAEAASEHLLKFIWASWGYDKHLELSRYPGARQLERLDQL